MVDGGWQAVRLDGHQITHSPGGPTSAIRRPIPGNPLSPASLRPVSLSVGFAVCLPSV